MTPRCTRCGAEIPNLGVAREACPKPPHGAKAKQGEAAIGHTLRMEDHRALVMEEIRED